MSEHTLFDHFYKKGYEQGKADAEKELQGLKDLGKLYSEVRSDAFEEYNESLKEHWIEEEDLGLSDVFFEYVDKIAEQLKNQKGE